MKKAYINLGITVLVVASMIAAIVYLMNNSLFSVDFLSTNYLNKTFAYQVTTLLLSFVIVLITALQTGFQSVKLLSVKNIDGEVIPEPWIGITEKNKDTWKKGGLNITIIISLATAVTIYFQVYRNGVIRTLSITSFLLVVLFALTNSFVEEVTFRHTFASIVEYHQLSPFISKTLSLITFGGAHYFGTPGKIPGVILAGFLAWFLTKSIHETKGFFWAWLIHFLQDVIIMSALYLTLA
ncbi:MAG TPA: CPBP family glutamic-type intramembrane protease [Bacillota bacterium]|nr:CPBP family glutamic-type intramembrane protease [Bacillota bacterium]